MDLCDVQIFWRVAQTYNIMVYLCLVSQVSKDKAVDFATRTESPEATNNGVQQPTSSSGSQYASTSATHPLQVVIIIFFIVTISI